MTRLVTFLHRKPRTRRERLLLRLRSVPVDARKRWEGLRQHRRRRADRARVETLLLQLGRKPGDGSERPAARVRQLRLHVPRTRR